MMNDKMLVLPDHDPDKSRRTWANPTTLIPIPFSATIVGTVLDPSGFAANDEQTEQFFITLATDHGLDDVRFQIAGTPPSPTIAVTGAWFVRVVQYSAGSLQALTTSRVVTRFDDRNILLTRSVRRMTYGASIFLEITARSGNGTPFWTGASGIRGSVQMVR